MGLFKSFTDMKDMVSAAPGLIESANQLAAAAQAQAAMQAEFGQSYANNLNTAQAGEVQPGNLDPIAGVTLEQYSSVVKGIAAYGYDQQKLVPVAASHGIPADRWALAQAGWGTRIQDDRAVGVRFNAIYTAG